MPPAAYRLIVLAAEANDRASRTVHAQTYDVRVGESAHRITGDFVGRLNALHRACTHAVFVDAVAYADEGDHRTLARTSASVGHHSGTYGMADAAIHAAMALAEDGLVPRAATADPFAL